MRHVATRVGFTTIQYTEHAITDKAQCKLLDRLGDQGGAKMPSAADGSDNFISVQSECHQCFA